MRERWVKRIVILSTALLLSCAFALAWLQNPGGPERREVAGGADASPGADAQAARGQALFASQGCQRCHSVAGEGSPRSPLDGVGARLDAAQLRGWVVGDPSVATGLPGRIRAAKEDYAQLPAEDLDALVAYLGSLEAEAH